MSLSKICLKNSYRLTVLSARRNPGRMLFKSVFSRRFTTQQCAGRFVITAVWRRFDVD